MNIKRDQTSEQNLSCLIKVISLKCFAKISEDGVCVVLILTKKERKENWRKWHFMTNITSVVCNKITTLGYSYVTSVQVFFQSVVCDNTHLHLQPCTAESDAFSKDSFRKMLCHTALFMWRREATATSEINPLWTGMSLPHTYTQTHTVCSRLGCAAQSKWISSSLIWLVPVAIWDWDDKAMTSASLTAANYEVADT